MAKKKASSDFVLTAAVREVLQRDPNLRANDVVAIIRKENPNAKINEASCKVAFSNERRKLGIAKGRRRKVRRPRAALFAARKAPRALSLDLLQAARNLIAVAGNSDNAMAAVRQVASLQVK